MSYAYETDELYYGEHGPGSGSDDLINEINYLQSSDEQQGQSSPSPSFGSFQPAYSAPQQYAYYQGQAQQGYYPASNLPAAFHGPPSSSSSDSGYDQTGLAPVSYHASEAHFGPIPNDSGAYMRQQGISAPVTATRQPEAMHVATQRPRNQHGITLRPVSALPDIYRGLFKFGVFNAMQSQCFETAFNQDDNMVISAPTGSGKTVIFELAIIRLLMEGDSAAKCVYMAPTKALCSERFQDWTNKFQGLGISCCELTGDTMETGRNAWGRAKNSTIIITTPEKWDSLTRNWSDNSTILAQMNLFLVDEVHILNELRGSTLEVCLARMRSKGSSVRFILVSATVPNVDDVAAWIGDASGGDDEQPAKVMKFGEEFRPCPIKRYVYGFQRKSGASDYQFNASLDYKVFSLLRDHVQRKPALVFCATRKGVLSTAEQIVKEYKVLLDSKEELPWPVPQRVDRTFHDKTLHELACYGVGVHHAGCSLQDRKAIEQLFTQKQLYVVVCTSTLAVGVNFPAHTVVIKGTKQWTDKGWVEYSDLDIMQMVGRAGRPQFDNEGVAVIITESSQEARYNALTSGRTFLESSLHLALTEHINSEIKLGTISSTATARRWIRSSFLFQRIQKNPRHYCVGKDETQSWEARLEELVDESLKKLEAAELIFVDNDGQDISTTEYGNVMCRYYIRFNTMCLILQLPEKIGLREMLETISNAAEFQDVRLRSGEKTMLETLSMESSIRFKPQKILKPADKVFLLIQAVLGGVSLNSPEWKTQDSQAPHLEALAIFKHAPKLARAIADVGILKSNGYHIKYGLELMRSLNARTWEDRPGVLKQVDQIGEKYLNTLYLGDIKDIASLRRTPAQRIESLLNRNPPFGRNVLNAVKAIPEYTLSVEEVSVKPSSNNRPVRAKLQITVSAVCETGKQKKGKSAIAGMTSILALTSDMEVIDYRRIPTKALLEEDRSYEIDAFLAKPSQVVTVSISSENFAGLTVVSEYKPGLLPSQYPTMDTRPGRGDNGTIQDQPPEGEAVDDADYLDLTIDDDDLSHLDSGTAKASNRSLPAKNKRPSSVAGKGRGRLQSEPSTNRKPPTIGKTRRVTGRAGRAPPSSGPETGLRGGNRPVASLPLKAEGTESDSAFVQPPHTASKRGRAPTTKAVPLATKGVARFDPISGKSAFRNKRPSSDDEDELPDVDSAIRDAMASREPNDSTDDGSQEALPQTTKVEALSPSAVLQTPPQRGTRKLNKTDEGSHKRSPDSWTWSPSPPSKRQRVDGPKPTAADPPPLVSEPGSARSGKLAAFRNPLVRPSAFQEFSATRDLSSKTEQLSPKRDSPRETVTPLFLPDSDEATMCFQPVKEYTSSDPNLPFDTGSDLILPTSTDNKCEILPLEGVDETFSDSGAFDDVMNEDILDETHIDEDISAVPDVLDDGVGESIPEADFNSTAGTNWKGSSDSYTEETRLVAHPAELDTTDAATNDLMEPVNFGSGSTSSRLPSSNPEVGKTQTREDEFMFDDETTEIDDAAFAEFDEWLTDGHNLPN